MKLHFSYSLFLLLFYSFACSTSNNQSTSTAVEQEQDQAPSRWQLYRAYSDKEILILYGAEDETIINQYHTLVDDIVSSLPKDATNQLTISHKASSEVSADDDLTDKILFLVGTPDNNAFIQPLTNQLSIGFANDSFAMMMKLFFNNLSSLRNKEFDFYGILLILHFMKIRYVQQLVYLAKIGSFKMN